MMNRPYDIQRIQKLLELCPAAAMPGDRQCDTTTLARKLKADAYFDL